ncbi:MAG TPA: DUF6476 family protein [Rhizomicrobium sp.]
MTEVSETTMPADVDPKSTLSYRSLKAVVIVLGALIVLALILVVVGIGMRMSGHAPGQAAVSAGSYGLPAGSKILSMQVATNRLIMEVQEPDGTRVLIFSTDDGHLVGQITPQSTK